MSGEIWEIPASEHASNSFATVASVENLSTTPKRLFTLGLEERRPGELISSFELEVRVERRTGWLDVVRSGRSG